MNDFTLLMFEKKTPYTTKYIDLIIFVIGLNFFLPIVIVLS